MIIKTGLKKATNRYRRQNNMTEIDFMREQLNKIEKRVNEIAKNLDEIRDTFSHYKGESAMRSRFINWFYMVATIFVALIANDYIIRKLFGD